MDAQRAQHLMRLSQATESPVLSRFYRHQARMLRKKTKFVGYNPQSAAELRYPGDGHCPRCSALWTEENHRRRLQPRMRLSKTLRRLQLRAAADQRCLGSCQRRLLDLYTHSTNSLLVTCLTCGERLTVPGQSRADRSLQQQHAALALVAPEVPRKTKKEKKKEKQKLKRKRDREERLGLSQTSLGASAPTPASASTALSRSSPASLAALSPGCSTPSQTGSRSFGSPQLTSTPITSTPITSTPITSTPTDRQRRPPTPRGHPGARPGGTPRPGTGTAAVASLSRRLAAPPPRQPGAGHAGGGSGSKRRRGKALHQQLQQALAQKSSQLGSSSGGSLSAFLTSLRNSPL